MVFSKDEHVESGELSRSYNYMSDEDVKIMNKERTLCVVILAIIGILFGVSLSFFFIHVVGRIHSLENDLNQLNHNLEEVRALGTQIIGNILEPQTQSDDQLAQIRKTIRRTIRKTFQKTFRKVIKKVAKKIDCDVTSDVINDVINQLAKNSTSIFSKMMIDTIAIPNTDEIFDVDHTGDGFIFVRTFKTSDGVELERNFVNDNDGMETELHLQKRWKRRLDESNLPADDPYYDFSDDEDENDDEEYDDQDDYLDYSAERPSNPEIVVDDEYEAVTNLTKDAKTGEGKSIVKRSVVSATKDGVLVNSESYAEIKAKNYTHKRHEYGNGKSVTATPARSSALGYPWPLHRSVYENTNPKLYQESLTQEQPATTKKPSVSMRRSRVMSREDPSKAFRKIVKKPLLKSGDVEYEYYPSGEIFTTPETTTADFGKHRKLGRARPLISIQFNGDTSKYVLGKHDNFNGNGHMRHAQRNFVDWVSSDWARKTGMDSHFSMTDGVVTVKESGIYFVYAQIYYLDEHDTTGFRVFKNNNMILQCTITQHSAIASMKGNTCYTAGVEFFSAGDTVFLSDITPGKYSLFEPGKSFFGLVKFGDFKNK